MAQPTRYFKLGAFVIAALAVLIATIVLIGSGSFGRHSVMMETYFDESVQGLDVGSRVKYRGVTVGSVTGITFSLTRYELDKPAGERKQYVMVEAEIDGSLIGGRFAATADRQKLVDQQIERGLRVRLASQGLTGTMYMEVDFVDPKNAIPKLPINWQPVAVYVPSAPSTQTQILDAISEVVARLRNLDIESTVASLKRTLDVVSRQLEAVPLERLGNDATTLLAELRRTNDRLAKRIDSLPVERLGNELASLVAEVRQSNQALAKVLGDPALASLPGELQAAVSGARRAFDSPAMQQIPVDAQAAVARLRQVLDNPELGRTVTNLQRSVGRLERILVGREGDIATTLENLRVISDNLRDTTETARRYPSSILLGEPPPASSVPRGPAR